MIDPVTERWLRSRHEDHSIPEIASRLGCCDDTAKRVLMRLGLRFYSGAKFVLARSRIERDEWTRPCMVCGCARSRPRLQYRCNSCTERYTE